ncbi:hypothetical protein GNF80_06645 [Clostridium perfringens]|nr:hypothetical protein [Clostridium perfringens]
MSSYISKYKIEKVLDDLMTKDITTVEFEPDGEFIEYSIILNYIEKLRLDGREKLHYNVNLYKNQAGDINHKLVKILDYVLLEIPRANKFDILQEQINRSDILSRNIRAAQRESSERMASHEQKIEKMQGDFISILSIFSAVIIAFFGGMSVLGSVFASIDKVSKYRIIFMTALVGFIMFNLIYMLLHSISKITKNRISVDIESDRCWGCEENYFIKCLATKYPIVFIYNIATVAICACTFIAYICDKYNLITYIIERFNIASEQYKINFIPIVGFIFLGVLLIIIYIFNKKVKPLNKLSCNNKETKVCG